MPRQPPIPPGPPTPADAGGSRGPPPSTPPKDKGDDDQDGKRVPESLSGYTFDKEAVRRIIEKHFRVYEERDALPGFQRALLVAFYVLADKEQIDAELPRLHEELTQLDPQLQPMLREEAGETLIVVTRRPREAQEVRSSRLPLALALLTFAAITLSGSMFWMSYWGEHRLMAMFQPENLLYGAITFTAPLLVFFAAQDIVRRIVAAKHGYKVRTSLLIPVPPVLFVPPLGTFGGITNPGNPAPHRAAMFDTAAAGPIAGFLVAVLIVILGLGLTLETGLVHGDDVELEIFVDAPGRDEPWREGAGLLQNFERSVPEEPHFAHNITVDFRAETAGRGYGTEDWQITIVPHGIGREGVDYTLGWQARGDEDQVLASNTTMGTVETRENLTFAFDIPEATHAVTARLEYSVPDRTSVPLGEPIAFSALTDYVWEEDEGEDLLLHPTAVAGWTALFITGITLLPVGRFDGGAIARALFGHRMTILAYITIAGLAVLALFYAGWVYLILIIVLFLSVRHPTPLDDTTPLDRHRQMFTVVLIALLFICFVPIPSTLPGLGFLG